MSDSVMCDDVTCDDVMGDGRCQSIALQQTIINNTDDTRQDNKDKTGALYQSMHVMTRSI